MVAHAELFFQPSLFGRHGEEERISWIVFQTELGDALIRHIGHTNGSVTRGSNGTNLDRDASISVRPDRGWLFIRVKSLAY